MKQNKDLIDRTRALVEETERTHRYSMSRIYGMYNELYGTNEVPQSCASCLIRKMKKLKEWLEQNDTPPVSSPRNTGKRKKQS